MPQEPGRDAPHQYRLRHEASHRSPLRRCRGPVGQEALLVQGCHKSGKLQISVEYCGETKDSVCLCLDHRVYAHIRLLQTPEEISVTNTVITVPAYLTTCNDRPPRTPVSSRASTSAHHQQAHCCRHRVRFDKQIIRKRNVLVLDHCRGPFDVSLLTIEEGDGWQHPSSRRGLRQQACQHFVQE